MYSLYYTGQFKRDLKRLKKRSVKDFNILKSFVEKLTETGFKGVPKKHNPHYLIGQYSDHCECHIKNDLLLIWLQNDDEKTIYLVRTGTHSDLF